MINFFISELVNKNGTRLGNDNIKLSVDDSITTSNSTLDVMYNPETGKQIKNSTIQSTRQLGYNDWYSTSPISSMKIDAIDKNIDYMKNKSKKTKIKRINKKQIDEIIEDLVRKTYSKDIVDNMSDENDIVLKNGTIKDLDSLSEENPLLVRKVKALVDIIDKNQATGEQKGIIINYLINNIGVIDLPTQYKKEIRRKF